MEIPTAYIQFKNSEYRMLNKIIILQELIYETNINKNIFRKWHFKIVVLYDTVIHGILRVKRMKIWIYKQKKWLDIYLKRNYLLRVYIDFSPDNIIYYWRIFIFLETNYNIKLMLNCIICEIG